MGFTNPGELFVQRFGTVKSRDDVIRFVEFLRQEAGLADILPVDLSKIYQHFEMPAPKRAPLPNQQGLLVNPEQGIVLINVDDPVTRQRFTEGHELIELLFSTLPTGKGWAARKVGGFTQNQKERLCNEGAAELLMPRSPFLQRTRKLGVSFESGRQLSTEFHVSTTAALVQMARVAPGRHAVVLWKLKNKPSEIRVKTSRNQLSLFGNRVSSDFPKRLRVEWSLANAKVQFIPADKSVPEDTSIYDALRHNQFTSGTDYLELGKYRGWFNSENQPFEFDNQSFVLSLLHCPGDKGCLASYSP